jgi:hypothetical protein
MSSAALIASFSFVSPFAAAAKSIVKNVNGLFP